MSAPRINLLSLDANTGSRRRASADFEELLNSETKEHDWQDFFDRNPFVLTESLSLRATELYSQVRLSSGVPDFVFRHQGPMDLLSEHGVVELKRPSDRIVGVYSTKHIHPSRKLVIAESQATRHLNAIEAGEFLASEDFFVAGNKAYAFIIMGTSQEIVGKCRTDLFRRQFCNLLPRGFHLYTYDDVLTRFNALNPPTIRVLFLSRAAGEPVTIDGKTGLNYLYGLDIDQAVQVAHLCYKFRSDVTFTRGNRSAKRSREENGSHFLMALLSLSIRHRQSVDITASGEDAPEVLRQLRRLFETGFEELRPVSEEAKTQATRQVDDPIPDF